jgi:hypothetical protein
MAWMKKVDNDRRTTLTHDFVQGHEYEVMVRAVGVDGVAQPIEAAARETIMIVGKEDNPATGLDLTATGFLNSILLAWTNPSDPDFYVMEVWRGASSSIGSATKLTDAFGESYIDVVGAPNLTYYYWIRAVDTSGNVSDYYPLTGAGVDGTSDGVDATSIDDFAITATKMFTNTIVLSGDSWTNNSPVAGSVAWNTHTVVYNGAAYPIAAGSTSSAYVYWTIGDVLYTGSATHPVLGNDAFMIAINQSGIHTMVWNSSANMVIGTAFIANLAVTEAKIGALAVTNAKIGLLAVQEGNIANLAVTNAKINSLSASKLTAGTIDASVITVTNLNADNISTGTLTGRRVVVHPVGGGTVEISPSSTIGFRMLNAADAVRVHFQTGGVDDGDATIGDYAGGKGVKWDESAGTFNIKGILTISGGSGIANLTDAGSLATKSAVGASDCDTTIISGGKIITGLLTADNVQAGTLTGRTVQTASGTGQRMVMDSSDNTLRFYNSSNTNVLTIDDDADFTDSPSITMLTKGGRLHTYRDTDNDIDIINYPTVGTLAERCQITIFSESGTSTIPAIITAWDTSATGNSDILAVVSSAVGGAGYSGNKLFVVGCSSGVWSKYKIKTDDVYYVGSNKVVGAQGDAVADATDADDVITQLNTLLSRLRAHGLIGT